jgi:hypothetical protein
MGEVREPADETLLSFQDFGPTSVAAQKTGGEHYIICSARPKRVESVGDKNCDAEND